MTLLRHINYYSSMQDTPYIEQYRSDGPTEKSGNMISALMFMCSSGYPAYSAQAATSLFIWDLILQLKGIFRELLGINNKATAQLGLASS